MNNKLIGNKPLYVALAQRKEDRKAQLASQYMQRLVRSCPYYTIHKHIGIIKTQL
jgi:hypothetical protein